MITDNYIKMCEQAEEIQKAWKPKYGDEFTGIAMIETGESELEGNVFVISYCEDSWYSVYPKGMNEGLDDGKPNGAFWLPTVEQLFEMVGDYKAQINRVFLSIMVMKKYKYESRQIHYSRIYRQKP